MRGKLGFLLVGAAFAFGSVPIQCQRARPTQEQTAFSAEDEGVKHPVPLPSEVLAILQRDNLVKNELKYGENAPEKLPPAWFSASEIALGSSGEKDLIIAAEGPLAGGNVDTFWVFVQREHHYTLVLTIPAHDLVVKRPHTNGYRNLQASGATAATVTTLSFRFNGRQYKEYSTTTEDIK
jgi:hypothetical protein